MIDCTVDLDGLTTAQHVRLVSDQHLAFVIQAKENFLAVVTVRRMGPCAWADFGDVQVELVVTCAVSEHEAGDALYVGSFFYQRCFSSSSAVGGLGPSWINPCWRNSSAFA